MKCVKAQELFSSYLEKTIQPPLGLALEQHLAECAQCKAEYDRFHATAVVLDELPIVEPPPDMHAVIMARIERARREAPGRVKWLHLDWQSVFTLRVPAKALAMGAAMLLMLVMLVQMTPLHTMTASIIGGQRASEMKFDDPSIGPRILPQGVKPDSATKYADLAGGLSIGVWADVNSAGTVYTMRLATRGAEEIPVQVYLLRDGSIGDGPSVDGMSYILREETVAAKHSAVVPVVITQPGSSRGAKVAMVTWKSDGNAYSEFVFLPSSFGVADMEAGLSVREVGVCDILSRLSMSYGAVILAPGDLATKTASVNVGAGMMSEAMKQAGLTWQPLAKSVYEVK